MAADGIGNGSKGISFWKGLVIIDLTVYSSVRIKVCASKGKEVRLWSASVKNQKRKTYQFLKKTISGGF